MNKKTFLGVLLVFNVGLLMVSLVCGKYVNSDDNNIDDRVNRAVYGKREVKHELRYNFEVLRIPVLDSSLLLAKNICYIVNRVMGFEESMPVYEHILWAVDSFMVLDNKFLYIKGEMFLYVITHKDIDSLCMWRRHTYILTCPNAVNILVCGMEALQDTLTDFKDVTLKKGGITWDLLNRCEIYSKTIKWYNFKYYIPETELKIHCMVSF